MNLLTLKGLTGVDPVMQAMIALTPSADKINNNLVGDDRNYSGYRFNQRNNELLDNVTGKADYNLSPKHAVSATYAHNRDNSDRPGRVEQLRHHTVGHESDACRPGGGIVALDAGCDPDQRTARRLQPHLRLLR